MPTTSVERARCLAITGPTACGKTGHALSLARDFPIEIISMDSAMVYRGMDIGTAKPGRETRKDVPHHLIDIVEPEAAYSAGRFAADATHLVAEIAARGKLPVVVGGTMLYLKALREGIAPLPERDPAIRARIDARAKAKGWEALHAELKDIDPQAAARIEPTDRQRIQRALEVHTITGRPLSELQQAGSAPSVVVESVALMPYDRERLKTTIERRFEAMVEQGLIDEVRRLRARPGLTASSPSMRAVGYRQVFAHLEGRWDWPETARRAVVATRQLAKRQLTWLRGDRQTETLDADDPALADRLKRRLERFESA